MVMLTTLWPVFVKVYQSASPDGQRSRVSVVGAVIGVACASVSFGSPGSLPHCWIVNCIACVAPSSVVPAMQVGPGSVQPYCAYQLEPTSDGTFGIGCVNDAAPPRLMVTKNTAATCVLTQTLALPTCTGGT